MRFDFNDARGERRGSWDELTELDFRGKSSFNTLPSPVEAGLARLGQASDVMLMICYCALIGVNMHGIFTPHATPQDTSQDPKETGYPVWGTEANMQASRFGLLIPLESLYTYPSIVPLPQLCHCPSHSAISPKEQLLYDKHL